MFMDLVNYLKRNQYTKFEVYIVLISIVCIVTVLNFSLGVLAYWGLYNIVKPKNLQCESKQMIVSEQDIKDKITWICEYDKDLEDSIIDTIMKTPKNILNKWYLCNGTIKVCPYNKVTGLYKSEEYKDGVVIADITYDTSGLLDYNINGSEIRLLSNKSTIENSLLHEIGHFVCNDLKLDLNFKMSEKQLFIEEEQDGFNYFRDNDEYFAEMFQYTLLNPDSHAYSTDYIRTICKLYD